MSFDILQPTLTPKIKKGEALKFQSLTYQITDRYDIVNITGIGLITGG
jgi:hypothetical protein